MHHSPARLSTLLLFISLSEVHSEYDYDYGLGESVSKSCSVSESISGGTVEFSSGGSVGSRMIYHCTDGFQPYPISQRVCNSNGEWEPKVSRVKCEEIGDYGDYEDQQKNCSLEVSIKDGRLSFSNGGIEGSVLTYQCETGHYPFPTAQRVCSRDGKWSAMRLPTGKKTLSAVCKEVLCPAQIQLDNGQFWPRRHWLRVGEKQTFSCHEGFILTGSAERNCTHYGGWTGTTPVCDDQSEDCRDPGIPPGAKRFGRHFAIGDKVRYLCQSGLDILGSSERWCLDSREWSGAEPRCYAQYSFDQPAIVAQALGGSLSAALDVSLPDFKKKGQSLGRTIKVEEGRLNVFILMDTSGSISQDTFQAAKKAIIELVRKLDSYEVNMKFDIVSYASEPKEIVSITNFDSHDVDFVLRKLSEFSDEVHEKRRGTDLSKALERVYAQLALLRENKKSHFNETQNILIIATDGHSNMGPNPQIMLSKIRSLLGYKPSSVDHTQEELLDVYVFAVGKDVNRKDLMSFASSKKDEKHVFVLQDYQQLGYVFNQMISDSAVTKCGIAQEEQSGADDVSYTKPWHVDLLWGTKTCRGSIVSESMVLTAAHCLIKASGAKATPADIKITHGAGEVKAVELIVHPQFNVSGLKDKNVKEFYDYDIALIRMRENITISRQTRPICLPCTKSSNRALRMAAGATCDQHRRFLLHLEETPALFISQGTHRADTHIHSGAKREKCAEKARSVLQENSRATLTDIITERFMCTGGSDRNTHHITCKGDSGGALFLRRRMRYIQVAVISWGSRQTCDSRTALREAVLDASDFHTSVFALMPWLKQHLQQQISFIP
ncbi:complement factor B [Danio aesculapii]|uniref:complement factor B n=1 Tax=Danio aesculapii TaxID=1142201 RepID=UPI0024BFABEF|nr:complement factor B [Danio aesculapii]